MKPIVIEGEIPPFAREPYRGQETLDIEDGGQAVIATLYGNPNEEEGLFVRLQSWANLATRYRWDDPSLPAMHPDLADLAGKRVRVTIEVVE